MKRKKHKNLIKNSLEGYGQGFCHRNHRTFAQKGQGVRQRKIEVIKTKEIDKELYEYTRQEKEIEEQG